MVGVCLSFSTTGIRKRGREYIRGRELICAAIDGRIGGRLRCELYILLSLPLVSSVPVEKSRERANPDSPPSLSAGDRTLAA